MLLGPKCVYRVDLHAKQHADAGLRQLRKPEPHVQQQRNGVGTLGFLYGTGSMFTGEHQQSRLWELRKPEQKL